MVANEMEESWIRGEANRLILEINRIQDGKLVESWHIEDIPTLMMELGLMPAPPAATG